MRSRRAWSDENAARLDFEIEQLRRTGFEVTLDRDFLRRHSVVRLVVVGGGDTLEILYPDLYPYFRFEVLAPDLELPKHQNPYGRNLCLLGRRTDNWRLSDTAARVIGRQLPKLKASALSNEPTSPDLEEHQGEPAATYYGSVGGYLIDGRWSVGSRLNGTLTLGIGPNPYQEPILEQGAVLEIRSRRRLHGQARGPISRRYPRTLKGQWVRLASPPRAETPEELASVLAADAPRTLRDAPWNPIPMAGKAAETQIIGVVFADELAYDEEGENWVFLLRIRAAKETPPGDRSKVSDEKQVLVRAHRYGPADLRERIPELAQLSTATIVVLGAGGIGAPSIVEFAKAGVAEVRIVDHDFVEASTTVRWPIGLSAVGLAKPTALASFLRSEFPLTEVRESPEKIGRVRVDGEGERQDQVIDKLLSGADLVYDATAEPGVSRFMSEEARRRGIPYIEVSTTEGAWGGRVAVFLPDNDFCHGCLDYYLTDGTVAVPPKDESGRVQPAGCADPTFTGAGFDVASIAMTGVRLAVSTLVPGDGYPDADWNVATLRLRDGSGILPGSAEKYSLARHPHCQACEYRKSG